MKTRRAFTYFLLGFASFLSGCTADENDTFLRTNGRPVHDDEHGLGDAELEVHEADSDSDAGADATPVTDAGAPALCGKAGAPTGFSQRTIDVGGVDRQYLLFVPSSYANEPMALVLGIHGMTGTATKARNMFGLGLEGEAAGKAIFVYPQALPSKEPAFLGKTRWNVAAGSDDHAFIEALASSLESTYCIDHDKEYAVGFSNGAEMVSMLGCYHGDRYRAIAPVAPGGDGPNLPLSSKTCVGDVAVWTGVGTEDADHQVASTLVRDYYRTANGCTATTIATLPAGCRAHQGCRSGVPTTTCSYSAAHTWPTFATPWVWAFFDQFQ
jgi:polyhydroxybutyrate depolymerase